MKLIALLLLCTPAALSQTRVQLDPGHTRITWTLGAALHTVHGTFALRSANVTLEPDTGRLSGQIIIDARSGESGNSTRDERMHKSVLESDQFPEIVLTPDRIEGTLQNNGDSQLQIHGKLSIHGDIHEMVFPVQVHVENGTMTAQTRFVVPYVKWGMKSPSTFLLKVSDRVEIRIETAGELTSR